MLTLKELLEASEAVQVGVLSENSLKDLSNAALRLMGPDPGVGLLEQRELLQRCLRSSMSFRGIDYLALCQLTQDVEQNYLSRWPDALADNPPRIGPERVARAIASHLLDAGLSPDFLHRWWTYRIHHEPGSRPLSDLIGEAHGLVSCSARNYEVLVAFEAAPKGRSGMPPQWLNSVEVVGWLRANDFEVSGVKQNGGLRMEVSGRDTWSAIDAAIEIVDSLVARVSLGTRSHLLAVQRVWVVGERQPFSLRKRRRGVEIKSLYRENQLYSASDSRIDAAMDLLEPLVSGSPGPAVASGWAAIEGLLTGPGDGERGIPADRLASLVACSLPRAELTVLAYKLQDTGSDDLKRGLAGCSSNRDRAAFVANAIVRGDALNLLDQSDTAALTRMRSLLAEPHRVLNDVQVHARAAFRRLYRNRNLVLHWGKTNAIALRASLRTAAPLVGAGMDRIAHAWFVEKLLPLELAARASIRLGLVGVGGSMAPVDLLEP